MQANRLQSVVALALFAIAVAYLATLPRPLNPSDEAVHLYEAKRLLDGDVMYRDIFEIITPGYMYVMALLFWLFGTDIGTARIAMAVLHGATMALIGLTALRLQVRPALAWTAALAYLPLCQSAWPIASQHWLSTLLYIAVLFVLAADDRSTRRYVLAGVLLGCLIGVQQQRGVILAAGLALWAATDAWLNRNRSAHNHNPLARLLAFAIGVAAVVVPLLGMLVATAGFGPVWRALVIHPILNYGGQVDARWGYVGLLTLEYARTTNVTALFWLPAILVLNLGRLLGGLARRHDSARLRRQTLVLFIGAFSVLSIMYFPDFIHLAFIAPVMLLATAENIEALLRSRLMPPAVGRAAGIAVAATIALLCAHKLRRNAAVLHEMYPIVRETSFGRVAMQNARDVALYEQINALVDTVPGREIYAYPIVAHWYLLANATNPTRYGFFLASYNSPDQVQEVLDLLSRKRLPYIVSLPPPVIKGDPIMAYIARDYEPVAPDAPPGYQVYRHKTDAAAR